MTALERDSLCIRLEKDFLCIPSEKDSFCIRLENDSLYIALEKYSICIPLRSLLIRSFVCKNGRNSRVVVFVIRPPPNSKLSPQRSSPNIRKIISASLLNHFWNAKKRLPWIHQENLTKFGWSYLSYVPREIKKYLLLTLSKP